MAGFRRSFRRPSGASPRRRAVPHPSRGLRRLPLALLAIPAIGAVALAFAAFTEPARIAGRIGAETAAVRVVDGDTLVVAGVRVRIANLDCAERDTAEGQAASRAAGRILRDGARVACDLPGRRSYNREVGTCAIDGADFGRSMVRGGHCGRWTARD